MPPINHATTWNYSQAANKHHIPAPPAPNKVSHHFGCIYVMHHSGEYIVLSNETASNAIERTYNSDYISHWDLALIGGVIHHC